MSDKVSTNFYKYEVVRSTTASRAGIDNEPKDPQIYANATELAIHILEPLRAKFGVFSPTSWYRSEQLEKEICKQAFIDWCNDRKLDHNLPSSWNAYFAKKSHPLGQAADLIIPGITNDALFDYIVKNFKFDQVIREYAKPGQPNSGWVHVSWAGVNNRNQIIRIG